MKRSSLFAGTMLVALVSPAFGQIGTSENGTAKQYFIVQDLKSKKCMIVDEMPTSTDFSVVGSSTYKTRAEAEAGMKSSVICSMT